MANDPYVPKALVLVILLNDSKVPFSESQGAVFSVYFGENRRSQVADRGGIRD